MSVFCASVCLNLPESFWPLHLGPSGRFFLTASSGTFCALRLFCLGKISRKSKCFDDSIVLFQKVFKNDFKLSFILSKNP